MRIINRVSLIVSVFPAAVGPERRPNFKPQNEYRMPAYKDASFESRPVILEIYDAQETVPMGMGRSIEKTWAAPDIARDIARGFADGQPGSSIETGAAPAIFVIEEPERAPDGEWFIPADLLAEYRAKQDILLLNLVNIARKLYRENAFPQITDLMREAARFLKIEGEDWQDRPTSDGKKFCVFCQIAIPKAAVVCPNCRNVVDAEGLERVQKAVGVAVSLEIPSQVATGIALAQAGGLVSVLEDAGINTPAIRDAALSNVDDPGAKEFVTQFHERMAAKKGRS